jgi:hypothetical protein
LREAHSQTNELVGFEFTVKSCTQPSFSKVASAPPEQRRTQWLLKVHCKRYLDGITRESTLATGVVSHLLRDAGM